MFEEDRHKRHVAVQRNMGYMGARVKFANVFPTNSFSLGLKELPAHSRSLTILAMPHKRTSHPTALAGDSCLCPAPAPGGMLTASTQAAEILSSTDRQHMSMPSHTLAGNPDQQERGHSLATRKWSRALELRQERLVLSLLSLALC